jgi:hypothetical protein
MGKPYADTICLRMYRLSTFPLLVWTALTGYLTVFTFAYFKYRRRRNKLIENQRNN